MTYLCLYICSAAQLSMLCVMGLCVGLEGRGGCVCMCMCVGWSVRVYVRCVLCIYAYRSIYRTEGGIVENYF